MVRYYTFFGSTYGTGAYSDCSYNNTTSCTASSGAGSGSTGSSSGGLANTGVAIIGLVSLACLLICVALVAKFWRRSSKQKLAQQEASINQQQASSFDQGEQQPTHSDDDLNQ